MGAAALPIFVGASVGSGLLSASAARDAGAIAKSEAKTEAQLVGLQAKQKELDRTKRLNEAIASQITRAGAAGITLEGTPTETIKADVEEAAQAQAAESSGTKITQRAIRSKGKQAQKAARAKSMSSLIQSGMSTAAPFI